MSEGFQFLDLLILLALAIFFVSRLRNILGKTIDDNTRPKPKPPLKPGEVVQLRSQLKAQDTALAEEQDAPILADIGDPDVSKGLMEIKSAEPGFSVKEFVNGARMAFEMIIEAYNRGDKKLLEPLLEKEIFEEFSAALDAREASEETEETTLVAINEADIVKAGLKGKIARVTVKFVSEQIIVSRDKEGKIIEGDPSYPELVTDEWTFERQIRSQNPNWLLVDT
ncbi:MAG: Tim44/TimA family putative adaptor protein [Rickettsiales bacterium]